jgi:hypothetical protein
VNCGGGDVYWCEGETQNVELKNGGAAGGVDIKIAMHQFKRR